MKRILLVDLSSRTTKVGGEARVVAELFEGLQKPFRTYYLGFNTHYIDEQGSNKILLKKTLPVDAKTRKMRISELKVARIAYNIIFIRRRKWFGLHPDENNKVMEYAPNVVVSNSIADFPLLLYFKRKMNFKVVYVDHGSISTTALLGYFAKESIPLTVGSGIHGLSPESIRRKFFDFFDLNIALNKKQYEAIKKLTNKVAYIPNGIEVEVKKGGDDSRRFRERYGIGKNDFVILYLGRMFERQKRVSTLIDAFKMTKNPRLKLVLAGSGPSLAEYIETASGDSRIIFTHELQENQINAVYESADVFVLPSMWEGFSIVTLEAAAHKLPMILSDNAYIEDLKLKSIGPIPSFRTGDATGLHKLLEKIASDAKFRARAAASSAAIAKEFTPEKMVSKYKDAINRLTQ